MTTLTHADLQQIINAAGKATGWDRISIDATHAEALARIALAAVGWHQDLYHGGPQPIADLSNALRDAGLIP